MIIFGPHVVPQWQEMPAVAGYQVISGNFHCALQDAVISMVMFDNRVLPLRFNNVRRSGQQCDGLLNLRLVPVELAPEDSGNLFQYK